MKVAMIPARMGSQRLAKKNLRELNGVPLIIRAIRKCIDAKCFDEIWVNSEHDDFGPIAETEGVYFHKRPKELGDNQATSEQFITEFFEKHECKTCAFTILRKVCIAGLVRSMRSSSQVALQLQRG